MNEIESFLVLNAISGLSNIRIRKMLDFYGSAEKVLSLGKKDLEDSNILPEKTIQNILDFSKDIFLKNEYNLINKNQVKVITCKDKDYPRSLLEIPDAPIVLYVRGDISKHNKMSLAIVGSRKASFYGISIAEKFARELSLLGINVVSGMARGIDTAAHRGVLRSKGTTVAVLGNGLAGVYPPENRKLFEEISKTGAVISEFPMETQPLPFNFPRRNRIISGLSLGVIVVEAAQRSGALITADFALEQGKDVFAIPGKIDSLASKGVNNLIKQGAKLVTCVDDVLEDIELGISEFLKESEDKKEVKNYNSSSSSLNKEEEFIYGYVSDRPLHVDEITKKCGLAPALMASVLMKLELRRMVKQLPGKLFIR
ncbi:MAG: DNA-processing protein DprA [Candidatus Zapsychrus exili]|nr:DNA-processing protein DprA [Candidatus Zapsychrus exili]